MNHEYKIINIDNKTFKCDIKLIDCIITLNKLGFKTACCCQGNDSNDIDKTEQGYISFIKYIPKNKIEDVLGIIQYYFPNAYLIQDSYTETTIIELCWNDYLVLQNVKNDKECRIGRLKQKIYYQYKENNRIIRKYKIYEYINEKDNK